MIKRFRRWRSRVLLSLLVVLLHAGVWHDRATEPAIAQISCPIAQAVNPNQWLMQGTRSYEQGQFQQALVCWQQATIAYQRSGDRSRASISQINQAQALKALGFYPRACQEILQAFGVEPLNCTQLTAEQKINLLQTLKAQPVSQIQVTGLQSLGDLLRSLGELDFSQVMLQTSLDRATQLPSNPDTGAILLSLGTTAHALSNQFQELAFRTLEKSAATTAIAKARDAIALYQQAAQSNSQMTQIQAHLNQMSLLLAVEQGLQTLRSQPETAAWWAKFQPDMQSLAQTRPRILEQFAQARLQLQQLPLNRTTIQARLNLAQSLTRLQQLSEMPLLFAEMSQRIDRATIEPLLTTALQDAQTIGDRQLEAYALGYLGQLHQRSQQWLQAQELTHRAINLAQRMNAPGIRYQWEAQLGAILQAQGKTEGAIAAYSAAVNTLKSVRNDLLSLNPDIQFTFRDNVEPTYRQLVTLLLSSVAEPSEPELQQVLTTVDDLQKAQLENFLQCGLLPTVSLPTVVAREDPQAAIVYPIVLADRLEIIVQTANKPLFRTRTRVSRTDLEATLKELRTYLTRKDGGRKFEASASRVYDWLIRPIVPHLNSAQIQTLVFVLDGALRDVPMAALYRPEAGTDTGRYLIEEYAIAVTPGLNLLGPKRFAPQQLHILIGGLTLPRQLTVNNRQFAFNALPYVATEVQEIQSAFHDRADVLINQDPGREFTFDRFDDRLQSATYPIVHLATHGIFSSNPAETFIVTAAGEPIFVNDLQDLLQARKEVTPDPIELLVLSACQTAQGDRRAALGMAGVAVRSGASSTLATLWSVDDQSTALVMQSFYKALAQNLRQVDRASKAEILRQSQLQLLQLPEYRYRPYYWAAFVLIGNWL